jgi:hypothetical protein
MCGVVVTYVDMRARRHSSGVSDKRRTIRLSRVSEARGFPRELFVSRVPLLLNTLNLGHQSRQWRFQNTGQKTLVR